MDDNLSMQMEEIETLYSIYGDQWVTVDASQRSYSIQINEDSKNVVFFVTLPRDYPLSSPPTYELFAPSLSRDDKFSITDSLNSIYIENTGESIVFQWVEKIREILQKKIQENCVVSADESEECVNETEGDVYFKHTPESSSSSIKIPVITHGAPIVDRKSTFQAHVAIVDSVQQTKQVLENLLTSKKIANATHNIMAYRIKNPLNPSNHIQDCDDDGETQAGSRLLHLLQVVGVENIIVVVSRWYGGIHLGPDRFRHINNAARQVLELAGHIEKKKPSEQK